MKGALSGRLPARGSCLAAPGAGFRVPGGAVAGDAFGLGPGGFAGGGEVRVLGRSQDAFDGRVLSGAENAYQVGVFAASIVPTGTSARRLGRRRHCADDRPRVAVTSGSAGGWRHLRRLGAVSG
jgi:hypothetical protein